MQQQTQSFDSSVTIDQRLTVLSAIEVGDKIRVANEIGQRLSAVGFRRNGKMGFGPFIDPVDMAVFVKSDDAVRQSLKCPDEALQRLG